MTVRDNPVIANVERLHRFMDKNDLLAVVARSGASVTYLGGVAYPGTLARHLDLADSVRGVMLVWPRRGDPVIVVDAAAHDVTLRDSWIKRVERYQAYVESVYIVVGRVLNDLGLSRARVGFEKDVISAAHWEETQQALPQLEMVDCSQMMDQVRWIKTAGELAIFKKAADLLDEAYLEVFPTIRPGDTEREVHTRIVASCLRRGCGWVHGILNSGANDVLYGGEGDTAFHRGDIVRTDYVAYLSGYPGHQSRLAILGPPDVEQRRQYELTLAVHRMAISHCRPGVPAGTVYDAVVDEYRRAGVEYTASLVGHSVGAWFHQQEPILRKGNPVVLEEGMVLAIEPYRQHWHIQDLIVVRQDGPALISDRFPTDEMFVIE